MYSWFSPNTVKPQEWPPACPAVWSGLSLRLLSHSPHCPEPAPFGTIEMFMANQGRNKRLGLNPAKDAGCQDPALVAHCRLLQHPTESQHKKPVHQAPVPHCLLSLQTLLAGRACHCEGGYGHPPWLPPSVGQVLNTQYKNLQQPPGTRTKGEEAA